MANLDERVLKAITNLREENKQYATLSVLQGENREDLLADISLSMKELLDEMAMSRLDAEESRREQSKSGATPPPSPSPDQPEKEELEFGLKGILQTLAGIAAATAGFAAGLFAGFKSTLALITKRFTAPFKAIADVFKKRGTGQFLKGDSYKALGRTTEFFRKLADRFAKIEKTVKSMFKGTGNLFNIVKSYAGMIANTVKDIGKMGIDKIVQPFKNFGNYLLRLQNTISGLPDSRDAKAFGALVDKIKKPFVSFLEGFKKIGQAAGSMGKLGGVLGNIFRAFKFIGQKLFLPITIIMSIFDAFKGASAGMDRQVGTPNKIIGAIFGAITGVLKGLIAMPLDLIKDVISWIAGKLGFENFSKMLDSFSFGELFQMVGDRLADGFIKFFEGIGYFFTNIKDRLLGPFKDGFSFDAVIESVKMLPATIIGGILDWNKNLWSAILSFFGFEDASKELDSFSFMDMFDNIIDGVTGFITGWFGGITDSFNKIFEGDGPSLGKILGFIKDLGLSIISFPADFIKSVATSVLEFFGMQNSADALEGFSFKKVFGKMIDWVVGLPGRIVDGLMALLTGEVSVGDMISEAMTGAMNFATQLQEWVKGIVRPYLQDIAMSDGIFGGLQKKALEAIGAFEWAGVNAETGEVTAPKVSAPESTPQTSRGQDVAQMSKENAQAQGGAQVAVVNAPKTSQVVNNSQNTAAIMDQNLPTVDYNDRSWGLMGA